MLRTTSLALAAVAVFGLFSLAVPASAQVRVAVVPFEGNGAPGVRRDAQRALDGDRRVTVVDLDRVDQAAGRTGASSTTGATGVAELASELEARLVVQGTVDGRGRRREVLLVARDVSGNEVARETAQMRGRGVQNGVRRLLDAAIPRLPAPRQEVAEAPTQHTVRGAVDDEPARWGEQTTEPTPDATPDWTTRAPLVNVQIGVVGRGREADVTLAGGGHGRYSVFPYLELAARAEVRPLSRMGGYAAGLFVRGDGEVAVGLKSNFGATVVDTSYWRAAFDVGYGLPIADIVEIGVAFGAGWDSYGLSSASALPLESVEYLYLRPALRARIRLFQEYLVLDGETGVRPVLSRGGFQAYGGGDTTGFDVGGGLSGGIAFGELGVTWAVQVGWVSYWSSFTGGSGASGTDAGVRITAVAGLGWW